jgi:RNA polymerase sigma-70 factor, ECF subfamily
MTVRGDLLRNPKRGVPVEAGAQESDYALARAAAHGAVAAMGDLYVRHNRRVYSLCLRMTGNASEAEDLTQEVFVQLLRKIDSFRGDSQFTTWLYRVTVNEVLMHFRRTGCQTEVDDDVETAMAKSERGRQSPGTPVVDRLALKAALSDLPSGCRAVFLLFDVEGYKHEEIAKILGCSVGNSKSQLHKARKKLKRLLKLGRSKKIGGHIKHAEWRALTTVALR